MVKVSHAGAKRATRTASNAGTEAQDGGGTDPLLAHPAANSTGLSTALGAANLQQGDAPPPVGSLRDHRAASMLILIIRKAAAPLRAALDALAVRAKRLRRSAPVTMTRLLSNTDMGDVELMHRVQVAQSGILLGNNTLLGDINALRELLKGSSSEIINALDSLRASDAITSKRFAYLTHVCCRHQGLAG